MTDLTAMTEVEVELWRVRTHPDREAEEALTDPVWRLANIYSVLSRDGQVVPFSPTDEQRLVIWCIHARGWKRILIPKARQLGMSVVICLIGMDLAAWNEGWKSALIDRTAPEAEKKLREKVILPWEGLPSGLSAGVKIRPKAESLTWGEGETASSYEVGVSFRGGTLQWLHVSEWGEIQQTQRARSVEIRNGSLPAAEKGIVVVETTWHGGLDGELGPFVNEAQNVPEGEKGPTSWRMLFFPWWGNAGYAQEHGSIDEESRKYFEKLEATHAIKLTVEQKRWYSSQRRVLGNRAMRGQFPSIAAECWEAIPEGSIYGGLIERARSEGRLTSFLPDNRFPVHTFWDLGHPLNTVTWLVQVTPAEIRVLDCLMGKDMTLQERAAWLNATGFTFGNHFLPHDAANVQTIGGDQVAEFRKVMGGAVRVVPRVDDVWSGIRSLQGLFSRLVFRMPQCHASVDYLGRYHGKSETSSGVARDAPVHDRYSHAADALRQLAQAIDRGMIQGGQSVVSHSVQPRGSGVAIVRARSRL